MARERDAILVHVRQGEQVIDTTACRPGPPGQLGPVRTRPNRLPGLGVVARIRAGIDASDVTAAHRDERPMSMRILRDKNGQGRAGVREDEFDAQFRGAGGSEFERDFAQERAAFVAFLELSDGDVRGGSGPGARDVMLEEAEQFLAAFRPVIPDGLMAVGENQRLGKKRNARQLVEIRRHLAARLEPLFPGLGFWKRAENFLEQLLLPFGGWRGGGGDGEGNGHAGDKEWKELGHETVGELPGAPCRHASRSRCQGINSRSYSFQSPARAMSRARGAISVGSMPRSVARWLRRSSRLCSRRFSPSVRRLPR